MVQGNTNKRDGDLLNFAFSEPSSMWERSGFLHFLKAVHCTLWKDPRGVHFSFRVQKVVLRLDDNRADSAYFSFVSPNVDLLIKNNN